MATIGRVCCDCVHYQHGNLEDPCRLGDRYAGYLRSGCFRWKSYSNESVEIQKKVCAKCGQEKPITDFGTCRKTVDKLNKLCRVCDKERIMNQPKNRERRLAQAVQSE